MTETAEMSAASDVVAAMFADGDAAHAARDVLIGAGIAPGAIDVVDRSGVPAHAVPGHGLWARLHEMFTPHAHSHGYAEGVERGHAMVFVRAPAAQQAQVMHVLDGLQPLDVMQRAQEWSNAGWNGVHRSQAEPGAPGQMLFAQSGSEDHIPSTGLLNENDRVRGLGMPLVNPMGIEVPGVRTTGNERVRRYEAGIGGQMGQAA